MIELVKSATFDRWLVALKDRHAKARIEARIRRMSLGNLLIVLLCGGDKSTQDQDIVQAKALARQWRD